MFLHPSSRCKILLAMAAVSVLLARVSFAEDAESVYQEGVAKLRLAQSDHSALVPATKLLAKAASMFEAAGDEAKGAEVNSCLYWAKKKMTLADTQIVKSNVEVSKRLEATAKEIPVNEAEAMLKRANDFAQGHADDPLLVAIRYYEVGDRFKDNDFGRKAIDASLKFMQQVGEKAKLAEYKPAATDGKAFISSDPLGAAIILVDANGRQDTGKKTPTLIQLPKGKQSILLDKEGMKPSIFEVVIGDGITKASVVKLEPVTIPVDVLFEDGWLVFVDGKPVGDNAGKQAITPCTVEAPLGKHTLVLAKEGFQDLSQPIEVKEQATVELKQKPNKGTSTILKTAKSFEVPKVFLSDLAEKEVEIWDGSDLGKKGRWKTHNWGSFDISVNGNLLPNGLLAHPAEKSRVSSISYSLDGRYRSLQGGAALNDNSTGCSPMTFQVIGDEKVLWESRPVAKNHEKQEFSIPVVGVKKLVLKVKVNGDFHNAQAVWVDPLLK